MKKFVDFYEEYPDTESAATAFYNYVMDEIGVSDDQFEKLKSKAIELCNSRLGLVFHNDVADEIVRLYEFVKEYDSVC